MTTPLPDRIAAAIDELSKAACEAAKPHVSLSRAREARAALEAAIDEVVAEREWLQHHFPEQIAKALGTTIEVTGRTPSMVASCVAKVVAEVEQYRAVVARQVEDKRRLLTERNEARAVLELVAGNPKPTGRNKVMPNYDDPEDRFADLRADLRDQLAAAQAKLAAIGDWCHQAGRNLVPRPGCSDSFGDGIRQAQRTVSNILNGNGHGGPFAAAEQGGA